MTQGRSAPFGTGWLDVGNGHTLYYEEVGSPVGIPVVFLHGGPGSGFLQGARNPPNSERFRRIRFDQRAAGRSLPHASSEIVHWDSIDMDHHVADIEQLRRHLEIDRWAVWGGSWGSVLGLTYAQRHPEQVTAVIVSAVGAGTAADIDWLTVAAGRFYPAAWQDFHDYVPESLHHLRLVDAYNTLLMDPDPVVHDAAAIAWCRWEQAHVGHGVDAWFNPRYEDPAFRLGFARQVTHCWRNDSWLVPHEILDNMPRLAGIPAALIHGRLDVSSPLDNAWHIHQAWPGSTLHIVDDEGHGGDAMSTLTWQAINRLC